MIQSWDETAADIFAGRNTKAARRIPSALWPVVQRRLAYLRAAVTLQDVAAIPGHRLETLKGDQAGRYSIRVNQQYRVTFTWREGYAHDVRVEDYHR